MTFLVKQPQLTGLVQKISSETSLERTLPTDHQINPK